MIYIGHDTSGPLERLSTPTEFSVYQQDKPLESGLVDNFNRFRLAQEDSCTIKTADG
jgi:hypothetical protein